MMLQNADILPPHKMVSWPRKQRPEYTKSCQVKSILVLTGPI